MTAAEQSDVVVADTMVISAIIDAHRNPDRAVAYEALIAGRPAVVSFVTVTELRYGALRAGWGDLRRRSLERDLARLVVAQPDDVVIEACAALRDRCHRIGHGLGQKIHEADRWVAATAMAYSVPLVSDDAIFRDVAELTVLSTRS